VPGSLSECISEAVAEFEPGRVPSYSISPPATHRASGQVRIDGHDVDLCIAKEPVDDVLPGRPQPSLDDDAQFDADGGRHQPGEGILKVGRKFYAPRLAEYDRYGR